MCKLNKMCTNSIRRKQTSQEKYYIPGGGLRYEMDGDARRLA